MYIQLHYLIVYMQIDLFLTYKLSNNVINKK